MSIFDPTNQKRVSSSMSTAPAPVPVGEYRATITPFEEHKPEAVLWGPFEVKEIVSQKTGATYFVLKVPCKITDPNAPEEAQGRVVSFETFIDVTEEEELDTSPGKNTGLGQLREAVGQNEEGQDWGIEDLVGQPIKIMVTHRTNADGSRTYAECKQVAAA